ncbi:hypothetical protein F511_43569 [Dorcoceras hygrometricum]|uniref:Uncharacterized protein n=1 Tax=Dorcoceras hygrometricum TaxID=472368 RepID=A0A2Z7C5S2_9LAMI|nr:hypothetical protein F511_43569 [Dorcoceras hygrometricum]
MVRSDEVIASASQRQSCGPARFHRRNVKRGASQRAAQHRPATCAISRHSSAAQRASFSHRRATSSTSVERRRAASIAHRARPPRDSRASARVHAHGREAPPRKAAARRLNQNFEFLVDPI